MTKNKSLEIMVSVLTFIGSASIVAVVLNAILNLWDRVF